MKISSNWILRIIGLFFIISGSLAIINSSLNGGLDYIFWFCYLGLIILGIGTAFKNDFLIVSQLNLLAIPSVFWTVDFFYYLILEKPFLGITDYFFEAQSFSLGSFISLIHLFIVPVSLILLYKIKIKSKNAWRLSSIQAAILGTFSLLFTNPEININCVFEACIPVPNFAWPYLFTWILGVVAIIFVTSFILTKIKFLTYSENKKSLKG